MKHPEQATLALHAGGDLGRFLAWKTARHVARCGQCRDEVAAYESMREALPELGGEPDVAWNRIAGEMRANIRLGLAAGECVREEALPVRETPLFRGARMAIAMASVAALIVTGVVLERPTPPVVSAMVPVAQTTEDGIETRAGDRGFALMHKDAGAVTYTVGTQGTLGASYVDPHTGYVTMTKVYVE
jgi:hypothetical protein